MPFGRNGPCPCGSGLKYKKCHLPIEESERPTPEPMRSSLHDLDNRFVERVTRWAHRKFGSDFENADRILGPLKGEEAALPFLAPWAVYHHQIHGTPAFEWFAREEAALLSRRDRDWIDAQRGSWMSIWEVRETVPGKSMIVADLLSGEKRLVQEASGSRLLVARDVVLCRVVDFGDESIIGGMYPRPLPPDEGSRAVTALRRVMNVKLPIPVERLREFHVTLLVIAAWQAVIEAYDKRLQTPPRLQNTDGDVLRLTADHYQFAPADRVAIETAIASLTGAMPIEEGEDGTRSITFAKIGNRLHPDWDNTTIGLVITSECELRIETNSTRRANVLRKLVESAAGGLLAGHRRTAKDPRKEMLAAREVRTPTKETQPPMGPEVDALIRKQKASHYESWLEMSIPALGGKTPRRAARSREGRDALDSLLKGIENTEARQPVATRFDVNILRRALRMED